MKHLKMLGLAVVAATALMALGGAASASATTLCKVSGSTCAAGSRYATGTPVNLEATGEVTFKSGSTTLNRCTENTFNSATQNESGTFITSPISKTIWTGCNVSMIPRYSGYFTIQEVPGTNNGTLVGHSAEWVESTGFFGTCVYGWAASGTSMGTITGGAPATVKVSTTIPLIKNESGLCPSTEHMEASYKVSSPNPLYITS